MGWQGGEIHARTHTQTCEPPTALRVSRLPPAFLFAPPLTLEGGVTRCTSLRHVSLEGSTCNAHWPLSTLLSIPPSSIDSSASMDMLDTCKACLLELVMTFRGHRDAASQRMGGTLDRLLWLQHGCRVNLLRCRRCVLMAIGEASKPAK